METKLPTPLHLFLRQEDIKDSMRLIEELRDPLNGLSRHLLGLFSEQGRELVSAFEQIGLPLDQLREALAMELNRVLRSADLRNLEFRQGQELSDETKSLVARDLIGDDLVYCNRLLLEDAYCNAISRHPTPFLTDVRVVTLFREHLGALHVGERVLAEYGRLDGMQIRINDQDLSWEMLPEERKRAALSISAHDSSHFEALCRDLRDSGFNSDILLLQVSPSREEKSERKTEASKMSACKQKLFVELPLWKDGRTPRPYLVLLTTDSKDFEHRKELQFFDDIVHWVADFRSDPVSAILDFHTAKCRRDYSESKIRLQEDITVLFSDVEAYARQVETIPPERYVEVAGKLDQVLTQLCEIVRKHDGHVEKFIGDAIMATFEGNGNRPKHPDPAPHWERAVLAAVEAQQQLTKPNGWPKLNFGLASGRVLRGPFGPSWCHDYTVIGVPVNTAARLQSLAKGGAINVACSTCCDDPGTPERVRQKFGHLRWSDVRKEPIKREVYTYRELVWRSP